MSMEKMRWHAVLILVWLAVGFAAGCGRRIPAGPPAVDSAPKSAAVDTAPKLSGVEEVRAALEKKDYDGAMAALLRVRQTVTTEEQDVQFRALTIEVRKKMGEAAASDPKAAEASAALRQMTLGR